MGLARNRDVVSGAVLAALGAFVLVEALEWSYLGPDGPGPGFFPFWYGLLMIALSLALVLKAAFRPDPEARETIDWRGTGRALGAWTLFAGAIALMQPLGFPVAFALMAIGLVWLVMQKTLLSAVVTAVLSAALFWIVFVVLLGISLPVGTVWEPLLARLRFG